MQSKITKKMTNGTKIASCILYDFYSETIHKTLPYFHAYYQPEKETMFDVNRMHAQCSTKELIYNDTMCLKTMTY